MAHEAIKTENHHNRQVKLLISSAWFLNDELWEANKNTKKKYRRIWRSMFNVHAHFSFVRSSNIVCNYFMTQFYKKISFSIWIDWPLWYQFTYVYCICVYSYTNRSQNLIVHITSKTEHTHTHTSKNCLSKSRIKFIIWTWLQGLWL